MPTRFWEEEQEPYWDDDDLKNYFWDYYVHDFDDPLSEVINKWGEFELSLDGGKNYRYITISFDEFMQEMEREYNWDHWNLMRCCLEKMNGSPYVSWSIENLLKSTKKALGVDWDVPASEYGLYYCLGIVNNLPFDAETWNFVSSEYSEKQILKEIGLAAEKHGLNLKHHSYRASEIISTVCGANSPELTAFENGVPFTDIFT